MLIRKMLRDIRANKAQFIAIFLMIFLGVFIFTGVNSEWNGMLQSSESFYADTNMADVWVYGNGFTAEDVEKLAKETSIQDVERRALISLNVANNSKKKIEVQVLGKNTTSMMKVMQGEGYRSDVDGIWLDQSYAQENHIEVGDELHLVSDGIALTKQVKGIVLHPEYVYQNSQGNILPDHVNNGYAFVSQEYVAFHDALPYTQLVIRSDTPTEMKQLVSDVLEKSNLTFVERKDFTSYSMLKDEITQHRAFGEVFPIVFLLIAVLTTLTTLSKLMMNQRLQIGILKALGFSKRTIKVHYLSHVLVITALGAILGALCGPMLVPPLLYPLMEQAFVLPQLHAITASYNVVMVAGSVVACFIAAYFVCQKQLREKAADLLRGTISTYQKRREQDNAVWKKLNFYAQWNVRDIMRNKVRSCIALLGVAGCSGLLLCAFGMQDSMDAMVETMFHELQSYDMRVNISEQADTALLKQRMQGSALQEGAIELKAGTTTKSASLIVQEDTRYLKLQNTKQESVPLPNNGIALSNKSAQDLDLQVSDTIAWRIIGTQTWHESTIKELLYTPSAQGITMSKSEFEKAGIAFTPNAILGKKADIKQEVGVRSVQYLQADIVKSYDTMLEGMNVLILVLIAGAIILGFVVLYNITTFSYMEKIRDIATLKVLGFRNTKVKKLLRQQNFWLSLLGIFAGVPFGYALIYTMISTVGDAMDMRIVIQPTTYILCCLAALVVSMLVTIIVSRNCKHIDMVSALKSE